MKSAHQMYERHVKSPLSADDIDQFEDKLGLAESAIMASDLQFLGLVQKSLTEAELAFSNFRLAQLNNDFDTAQEQLKISVESSRKSDSRDHILEARSRMEWGLLRFTQGEEEQAGVDLRWAMERLKALSEGSLYHGLAILNMAEWHVSQNQSIMAMVILSGIDREGPHAEEIIATSRLSTSKLHFEVGDYVASQRHAWVAFTGCANNEMIESAIESGLIWLDLSLNEITDDAERMASIVANAAPRNVGENPELRAHPEDVKIVLDWFQNHWDIDYSGESRPDLAVLIEAEKVIDEPYFTSIISNSADIEDIEIINLLNQ
ncbi:MAG: hypothetical protein HOE69_03855 [Euryarchaeota archaeon]|nr:hypothetical protein [Euryarchaeota archaeon]